jgi:hypothetical protein
MIRHSRIDSATDAPWLIHYSKVDGEAIQESFQTKQMARDRFFTIKAGGGLSYIELRHPSGRVWFRDHYFGSKGHAGS